MDNYEQKYKEALERAKEMCVMPTDKATMEYIFPELMESYGEKIRKELIEHIKANYEADYVLFKKFSPDDVIAWLEKQGEKTSVVNFKAKDWYVSKVDGKIHNIYENSTDKIEPKFKVGDWVILPLSIIAHIDSLNSTDYQVTTTAGKICDFKISKQDNYHLWTIQDAKDGDVLAAEDKDKIFLYNGKLDLRGRVCAYCGIYKTYDGLRFTECAIGNYFTYKEPHPATKEQRDLLFQKMKETGYEWDADKKELWKIDAYQLSENPCSNCTNTKGCITCVNGDQKSTSTPRILYSDEVIEWLNHRELRYDDVVTTVIPDNSPTSVCHKVKWLSDEFIKKFKKDFGLC